MRRYRTGAHAKYDLKVHIVWVPKYRKRVLVGAVAVRVRDLLRQIATENDLHIISDDMINEYINEQEGEPVGEDSRFQSTLLEPLALQARVVQFAGVEREGKVGEEPVA
jgi:putative transposase